jgi:hypothetical protein
MHARRLLFVRAPRPASLVPVYLAFLAIAVVSVLGFALAYWPRDRVLRLPAGPGEAASSSEAHGGGMMIPSRARDLPAEPAGCRPRADPAADRPPRIGSGNATHLHASPG